MVHGLFGMFRFSQSKSSFCRSLSLLPKPSTCEQRRTIVIKELLKLPDDYPESWDYKEHGYQWRHAAIDRTMKRFHTNTRLITIEGNIGSEKSEIAKEIADVLGFHYMPQFKMEDIIVDRYGNDLRDFYHLFPKRFRVPDMNMFYNNPMDDMTAVMLDRIYFCRHEQYMNALAHITNTGQGVVLENSVFSDFVFANAMKQKNYIGKEYFRHYYYVRRLSLKPLMLYPHLVIYLDVPVDKCLENIKKRGNTDEINVCDEIFLETISRSFKDMVKEMKRHSHILAYDCTDPIDTDTIVEDVLKIDFDFYEWHSGDVMETWFALKDEVHWTQFRKYITSKIYPRMHSFDGIREHEVGELYINPQDAEHFVNVMKLEVLKDFHSYGYTHKDPKQGMGIWEGHRVLPENWSEYFYRELYYSTLHNFNSLIDPYAQNLNPDYLKHHH